MLATHNARSSRTLPLHDKTILLAGDRSRENEAIAYDLLRAGATLIWPWADPHGRNAPSRMGMNLDKSSLLRLHTPQFDVHGSRGVAQLSAHCKARFSGLDALVANFGDHQPGPKLQDTTLKECESLVSECLSAHLLLARAFVNELAARPGSAYIFVQDQGANSPCRGGVRTMAAAAELALAQSLAFEFGDRPHVYSLLVSSDCGGGDAVLTSENLGEAISLIVQDASCAKGNVVIQADWREKLDPRARVPDYISCL